MEPKQILIPMALTIILGISAGAGTFAYLSDTETSSGNVFTAGTLDVKIRNGAYDYQDDIGPVWTISDLKPGDETGSRSFDFRNYGSIEIDHMEITCDYSVDETSNPVESDTDPNTNLHPEKMAKEFTIITLEVYEDGGTPVDLIPNLPDWNGNGRPDLEDLKNAEIDDVTIVPDSNQGSYTTVDMVLEFDSGAGNDFQGDTLILTMIFTFNQHSSQ